MTQRNRGIALLVIQLLLISSIAGKYAYERATRPRVWARAAQYDPDLPIRGRYLALSPEVDACSLPRDKQSDSGWKDYNSGVPRNNAMWSVRVFARNGRLAVEDAQNVLPRGETQTIWLRENAACDHAPLSPGIDFFIPDTARSPFPLKSGQELWVESRCRPQDRRGPSNSRSTTMETGGC
jgi:hypothetical protein